MLIRVVRSGESDPGGPVQEGILGERFRDEPERKGNQTRKKKDWPRSLSYHGAVPSVKAAWLNDCCYRACIGRTPPSVRAAERRAPAVRVMFSVRAAVEGIQRRRCDVSRGAYVATGLATLTERIWGKTNGRTCQDFPASGLMNNWPVVVPT